MKEAALTHEIYYPPISTSDQKWGMNVTTAGYQSVPSDSIYPAGKHTAPYAFSYSNGRILDEYQLIYISKGKGIFSSGSVRETSMAEGNLLMLFPGEWHTYRPEKETGWNTFWVGFRGESIRRQVDAGFFSPESPVFNIGYDEKIVALFQEIFICAREERPGCQQLLAGAVSHLLGLINYNRKNEGISHDQVHRLIDKARMLMKEHVRQNISPEAIASQLNMSYSWFRRFFCRYTGITPGKYIAHLQIRQAGELLEQTNLPVREIAELFHFESAGYFSVFFKRHTGLSPLKYRESKRTRKMG